MKKLIFNFIIISALFFFYGCDVIPDVETAETTEVELEGSNEELSNVISIPNGFDFSTHHEVQITINDDDTYARYDVYIYSDEQYFVGTETFENQ